MAVDVSAFTAQARSEFLMGQIAAENRVMPANFDSFVTTIPSTVRIETHLHMSNLPRLYEFKGISPETPFVSTPYTVENKEYRIGPVSVRSTDLDDDQTGGYMMRIKALPEQGKRDIGFKVLDHLAAGTTNLCFDGTAFFADSHTIGTGDNLMTVDNAGNDGLTHKIIAMILTNSAFKPVLFQDRQSLSALEDDTGDAESRKRKQFSYWCDARFGLGYGLWHDAIHITITDTPTLPELDAILTSLCNRFRTFVLPKGRDADTALSVHEGWSPEAANFTILCSMGIAQILDKMRTTDLIATGASGATVNNQWQGRFQMIPTSALGT